MGGGGIERPLVEASGIAFKAYEEVPAGPIVGVNPLRAGASMVKMSAGVMQALGFIGRHRPQALLLTGGWANVPVAMAAWLRRVPILIYLPDIEPGSTIQVLKRFAQQVAITVPEAAQHFRDGQTVVTGYPLGTRVTGADRAAGVARFGLDASKRTLLIFGGSRGARNINIAIGDILSDLLADGWQVLHITGTLDWQRAQEQTAAVADHPHYHPFAYLDDMGLAFAAADLVICRSGASVLGELPYFGLPSILVPYPYAWRYQKTNADYLVERGAAVRVDDEAMDEQLLPTIRKLTANSVELEQMRKAARTLARDDAAAALAQALMALARS